GRLGAGAGRTIAAAARGGEGEGRDGERPGEWRHCSAPLLWCACRAQHPMVKIAGVAPACPVHTYRNPLVPLGASRTLAPAARHARRVTRVMAATSPAVAACDVRHR